MTNTKTSTISLVSLCLSLATMAQTPSDTTDVFFRHLTLGEVVVQGNTGEMRLKESSAPITIVTNKELKLTTSTNIIDALARQPGVAQITTGSGISKPVIRGLGYNRIVVINDGVRQEGQQWGDEHGIEVDAQDVHSVEILKGPASLMYGSDAMAGVILFHRAPTMPEGETKAEASTEYQTNNGLIGYSLHAAGNQKGWIWDARYSGKLAHAYKNKADGYVPNSQFREQCLSILTGINRTWGHSHLKLGYYHLTPSIIEGERDEQTGHLLAAGNNIKSYGKALPYQQIYHYKAVWDNAFHMRSGQLKTTIGYQQNQRKEFEEGEEDGRPIAEQELHFLLHTLTYDLRWQSEQHNGWQAYAGVGGMFQRSLNKGEEYLIPAYRLFDIGIFATAHKTMNRWTVNGGLRWDTRQLHSEGLMEDQETRFEEFSRHFHGLTGSMGIVWHANSAWNVRMNVSRGFRSPNLSELASNGIHEGSLRYEIGNRQLKAEHSWQCDWGIDFSAPILTAQVALFANRIDNYIFAHRLETTVKDSYLVYRFDSGDAMLAGFEAGMDFHPLHALHIGSSFSYVNAKQMHQPRQTRYLPMTPAPRWNTDIKYEITHDGRRLNNTFVSVGMECNLRQNHCYQADDTETATPSYTLFNISMGTDIVCKGKKAAELSITAENLTNRAYQNHLNRLKYTDINRRTGQQGICNMGRNIVCKLTVPIG